jgi:hypothetical protein
MFACGVRRRWNLLIFQGAVLFFTASAPRAVVAQSPVVSWKPTNLELTVFPGSSKSIALTITVAKQLPNAALMVVPALSGLLSFKDVTLGTLEGGVSYDVQGRLDVPLSTPVGMYQGTVHVLGAGNAGRGTVARPLSVTIHVQAPTGSSVPSILTLPSSDRISTDSDGQVLVKDELIVILSHDVSDPIAKIIEIAQATNGVIIGANSKTLTYQLRYALSSMSELDETRLRFGAFEGVRAVSHHYLASGLTATPNDPNYDVWNEANPSGRNWHLEYIKAPSAWDLTTGDSSVVVSVIDFTGFDAGHPDLKRNVVSGPSFGLASQDHGTHISGIACAEGNNGIGVSGVTWRCSLKLYSVEALDRTALVYIDSPVATQEAMIEAIDGTSQNVRHIANMSMQFVDTNKCGTPGTDTTLRKVAELNAIFEEPILYAKSQGKDVLWVISAGNECRDVKYASPASLAQAFPNVLAVASIGPSGELSSFSNFGQGVSVAAPGESVYSTLPRSCVLGVCYQTNYGDKSGTSMSAPVVAGAAALISSYHANLSASQLKDCIVGSSRQYSPVVHVISALEAVRCTYQPPTGSLDSINRLNQILGWAKDPDDPNAAISVHLYVDKNAGTPGAGPIPITANQFRSDVGSHAFNWNIPSNLRDGNTHTMWAWGIDLTDPLNNNALLPGSPRTFSISPPPTLPTGSDDSYAVVQGGTITIAAPGVLTNDNLNGATVQSVQFLNIPAGSFTNLGGGGFSFTPSPSAVGSIQFSYVVHTSVGDSNQAFITINVAAAGPVLTGIVPPAITAGPNDQSVLFLGSGFQQRLTMSVGLPGGGTSTLSGTQIQIVGPTSISTLVTFGSPGTYTFTVINPDGGTSPTLTLNVAAGPRQQTWTQAFPTLNPPPRENAAMAYDEARGEVVMFGGSGTLGAWLDDTWVWNGRDWREVSTGIPHPTARVYSAMTYDAARGQTVMFGGLTPNGPVGDTWIWNGSTWTQVFPTNSPPATFLHAMAYDAARGQVVMAGGLYDQYESEINTWIWDGFNWTNNTTSIRPPFREGHAMVYDSSRAEIVMFGGMGINDVLNDTWVWNGMAWRKMDVILSPWPRYSYGMAFDDASSQALVFGGDGITVVAGVSRAVPLGDTWTWNGANWNQQLPPASPCARDPQIVYAGMGKVLLFGGGDCSGIGGLPKNDTWIWGP